MGEGMEGWESERDAAESAFQPAGSRETSAKETRNSLSLSFVRKSRILIKVQVRTIGSVVPRILTRTARNKGTLRGKIEIKVESRFFSPRGV